MDMACVRTRFARRRKNLFGFSLFFGCLILGAYAAKAWEERVAPAQEDVLDDAVALSWGSQRSLSGDDSPTPEPTRFDDGYPPDLLLTKPYNESANQWTIVFHLLGILFMFAGLSIVCDEYFCAALEQMVDYWEIKPDVAGATFMAAGGSAPELFTSICGVFFSESDVGFGTIVGSAVFNVLFVIGLCAVASNTALSLTWWPLFRDCSYYIFGLGCLALFVADQEVEHWEAAILFVEYLGYVTVMRYNETLQGAATRLFRSKAVSPECNDRARLRAEKVRETARVMFSIKQELWRAAKLGKFSSATQAAMNNFRQLTAGTGKLKALASFVLRQKSEMGGQVRDSVIKVASKPRLPGSPRVQDYAQNEVAIQEVAEKSQETDPDETAKREEQKEEEKEGEEEEEEEEGGVFDIPDNLQGQIIYWVLLPINVWLAFTIPNCNAKYWKDKWDKIFLVTFFMSLVSIMLFSYFMVWWAAIIGQVIGISDTIMGLTLLAAGTSIPDALSSVYMARAGEGDMAVSSSIGSNVFDILVGLPLPWLMKTVLVDFDSTVTVHSEYVVAQVLLLLGMVAAVILSIYLSGWKLSRTLGGVMATLYGVFLAVSIFLETDQPGSEHFRW